MENNTLLPSYVVIAYDATKDRGAHELRLVVEQVRMRGDVLRSGNTLLVLGVIHKVPNPCSSKQMENTYPSKYQIIVKHKKSGSQFRSSKAPILCSVCGARTELYVDKMRFTFGEIQQATDDFSKDNLLGEGGYGRVYKGKLRDGQLIAAKVHKEASTQGFTEFQSEVYVLSFARHKNIVMLLGFCCKEKINILVYEYICNKSLYWHLFDKTANTLGWRQRFAIAIATAKGLRFLHEECRGGPIIHRDLRPSNILTLFQWSTSLPLCIGDFGLARWKNGDDPVQTRVLGTFGYLAPEYAENGVVSVKTDIYAFGIVLLQLISGRKVFDEKRVEGQQSLHQWAEPLLDGLALHELIDCRLGKSYERNELYLMAKATSLCMRRDPGARPSIGEVLRLLEGDDERVKHMKQRFAPQNKKH
ncbi:hypothetical protein K2173_026917 [Erythroxylum novogranatense]|uniref:Protein kinase domain-containing protein n=1 Tax=Erythroxylum novogranatense TaxID=1862640 RepID=A0AAV8U019_9ROSI|nr:hypothetical protein K2173_026917 [Erythroxylum novogranatense]